MDNSEWIAWLRVLIEILSDLDSEGDWRNHPLLQKWQANHYSLTKREFEKLCSYLNHQRELASSSHFLRKYKQLSLLDNRGKS